jgi:ABC-type Na+ efflux pump permease subunit
MAATAPAARAAPTPAPAHGPALLTAVARAARLHARVAFRGKRLAGPLVLAAVVVAGGAAARVGGMRPVHAFDLLVEWCWLLLYPAMIGLVLAAGAWGLEVEGRTLTYLLLRPVRRAHLYLGKILAVAALLAALGAAGAAASFVATWGPSGFATGWPYLARATAAAALAGAGYAALLGLFGVALGARAFMGGGAYLLLVEWLVAHGQIGLRWATLGFHLRVVAGVGDRPPGASAPLSALLVLGIAAACTGAGMVLAARREHRIAGGSS